jgi:phenylpropionate dioxygenase-like ring-hydroxylating dioxygenase large terminal subunit
VHVSDLTDPGDYVVFDLGPESILLTCNGAGTVQAFYNVCQHRGVRLVDDHSGNSENFRCPYHSWRYGTDGDLIYAPHQEGFQAACPSKLFVCPRCAVKKRWAFTGLTSIPRPSRSMSF